MNKYIIQINYKVDGDSKPLFFETISECTNNQVMNVFQEHLTSKKEKAKRFYDLEEAERFNHLFNASNRISKILTVKR
jgi:hypothetical protein